MAVNARGVLNMVQAAAPGMEARGRGRIVNVTSGTVYKGLPNMLHYIASKGAVAAMTRALSRELGPSGVTANALAPGLTLSDSILANAAHLADARDKVVASRAIPRDGYPEDLDRRARVPRVGGGGVRDGADDRGGRRVGEYVRSSLPSPLGEKVPEGRMRGIRHPSTGRRPFPFPCRHPRA